MDHSIQSGLYSSKYDDHAYADGGYSSRARPDRAPRNRTTQTAQKSKTKNSKRDQISPDIPDDNAALQTVATVESSPDNRRVSTKGPEADTRPDDGTAEATAGKENTDRHACDFGGGIDIDAITESGESSSDESVASDTGTIISIASSATAVDIDATEAIFRRLLLFQDLRYLWPQLVDRSGSRRMSVLTIERLLRRYSEDLSNLAASTEVLDDSDSFICLTACRFVRRWRLKIAHRIWEAHHVENEDYKEGDEEVKDPLGTDKTAEMTGDVDDMNFLYDISERFLFDTEPIMALQSSVKAFVVSQHLEADDFGSTFHKSVEIYFSNIMSFIYEPPLQPGSQRVRWKCICGQKLYDDYTELQPGAALKLEQLLQQYWSDRYVPKGVLNSATKLKPNQQGGVIAGGVKCLSNIWGSNKTSGTLPRHQRSKVSTSDLGVCSKLPGNTQGDHTFVLLCVPFMRWVAKLWQAEVCKINSDQDFFRVLRYYYNQHGKRSWTRFRKVEAINFVKFEVYQSQLVDVKNCPDVPTETQAVDNYTFDPLPAETNPPIGPKLLAHLLENPGHAEVLPVLYRKFPKKLRAKLQACPQKGSAVGWGVEFVEGLNWFIVFLCGCLGFMAALVSAIVWSVVRSDVQGGFAIAGFMLAFLGFCLGIARSEIQTA